MKTGGDAARKINVEPMRHNAILPWVIHLSFMAAYIFIFPERTSDIAGKRTKSRTRVMLPLSDMRYDVYDHVSENLWYLGLAIPWQWSSEIFSARIVG